MKAIKVTTCLAVFATVFAVGCTRKSQAPDTSAATSASSSAKVSHEVHLGIWSNYITPETIAEFEKTTGTKIIVSNFSSNEELLAKMQAGGAGFDVVVPSDYMVTSMVKLGLLKKLDRAKIPNAKTIGAR